MKSEQPIGVFDSGIGGLTIARALTRALPHETIIYFGDTAHLPYGDKSTAAIQAYTVKICDYLLQRGAKAILIACNSASAAAYDLAREYVASKALVFDVISPVVQVLASEHAHHRVGLIGTRQTVMSGAYERKLAALAPAMRLQPLATPLLAPMIEEGFFDNTVSHSVIAQYLLNPALAHIDALVLACTHYPLIRNEINDYYAGAVQIIDPSEAVAAYVQQTLAQHQLLAGAADGGKAHQFIVSDLTESFRHSTQLFFGQNVELTLHRLWE